MKGNNFANFGPFSMKFLITHKVLGHPSSIGFFWKEGEKLLSTTFSVQRKTATVSGKTGMNLIHITMTMVNKVIDN